MVLVLFSCFVCVIVLERERERNNVGVFWSIVLGWPWWWIGLWCFYCNEMDYFIVVDILFYCDIYIILLC